MLETDKIKELKDNVESIANVLKSFSHPKRLELLRLLSANSYNVQELESMTKVGQSQLSNFLRRMVLEGLLESNRNGRFVEYTVKDKRALDLLIALQSIFLEER